MRPRLAPADVLATTWHRPWPLPARPWVQRQSWLDFLFLHWRVPPDLVRAVVPAELELDLWDGSAWIGVIPFRMEGVSLRGLPDVPGFSAFYELNVRTYVRRGEGRGVHFLSLDADNRLAVRAARSWYGLPYWDAEQNCVIEGGSPVDRTTARFHYRSSRIHAGGPPARFDATWTVGPAVGVARPGTLEHWLCEQYALYLVDDGQPRKAEVHHVPWLLHTVTVEAIESTMAAHVGVRGPPDHALFSPGIDALAWTPEPA